MPENKTLKCANETTTTPNANSDSVVDIRRARRKYKKKLKCDKGNPFKLEWAKLSTDDSIEGPNKMNHDSLLSMNDLLVNIQKEIPSGKFDPTGMASYKKLAKKFRTRQAKWCPQGEFGKTICSRRQLATIAKMI